MIENSFVTFESDGKAVTVNFHEDEEVREGPAIFPARYASFAAIIQYAETQLNGHLLDLHQKVEIQSLLGSPWPHSKLRFYWKECQ